MTPQIVDPYFLNAPYVPSIVEAFPKSLEALIWEVAHDHNVHPLMVCSTILAALSMVLVPHADVTDPTGDTHPVGIFQIDFAASGAGKSATRKALFRAIRQWQKSRSHAVTMVRSHVTARALLEAFVADRHVVLAPSEGAALLDKDFVKLLWMLTQAWSNEPLDAGRGKSRLICDSPRLTLDLAIPRDSYEALPKSLRIALRNQGFLARALCQEIPPLQQARVFERIDGIGPVQCAFDARITELLNGAVVDGFQPIVLKFSDEASQCWIDFANDIDRYALPGHFLGDMTDAAAKAMNNVSRIAALFHLYLGRTGPISADLVKRAYDIAWHYLSEFKRLHATSQVISDAAKLYDYVQYYCSVHNQPFYSAALVANNWAYRDDKRRFYQALDYLVSANAVYITTTANRKKFINLYTLPPPPPYPLQHALN